MTTIKRRIGRIACGDGPADPRRGDPCPRLIALGVADLQTARAAADGTEGVPVQFLGGDPDLGAGYAFQAFTSEPRGFPHQAVPQRVVVGEAALAAPGRFPVSPDPLAHRSNASRRHALTAPSRSPGIA